MAESPTGVKRPLISEGIKKVETGELGHRGKHREQKKLLKEDHLQSVGVMMRFARSDEPVSFFVPDPENRKREVAHHIYLSKKYPPRSIITLTVGPQTRHYLVENYTPTPQPPSLKPVEGVDLSAPSNLDSEATFVSLLTLDDYAKAVKNGEVEYSVANGKLELSNNPANNPFRKRV